MNIILRIISAYIATLARIAPRLAVRQAFRIFQRPVAKKLRPKERAFYQQHPAQCIDTPRRLPRAWCRATDSAGSTCNFDMNQRGA